MVLEEEVKKVLFFTTEEKHDWTIKYETQGVYLEVAYTGFLNIRVVGEDFFFNGSRCNIKLNWKKMKNIAYKDNRYISKMNINCYEARLEISYS